MTPDGLVLDPEAAAPADRRTEAEKKHEEHMLKYEEARARKAAAKSHRWVGSAGWGWGLGEGQVRG